MTKFILLLALFLIAVPQLQAQNQDNRQLIDEYLRQSESRKKTGITMLAIGGGAAGLGLILAFSSNSWYDSSFEAGALLSGVGLTLAIISVPVLVGSASSARKAAKLSVGADTAQVINPKGPSLQIYPALNLSIPLNSTNR
jgi:hypothetical protein